MSSTATLYERLGVAPSADEATLRAAYRRLAKELHPDVGSPAVGVPTGEAMAAVNEAWTVLSDPSRRAAYDRTLIDLRDRVTVRPPRTDAPWSAAWSAQRPVPTTPGGRRDAWYAGVRVQMVRLTHEAASSAAWALSLKRGGRPRSVYEARIDSLIAHNMRDTDERVKAARAGGTAPLDLGLAGALVGLTDLANITYRDATISGLTTSHEVLAELLDRTWDNLAHGVSHEVASALGSNPHLVRRLHGR